MKSSITKSIFGGYDPVTRPIKDTPSAGEDVIVKKKKGNEIVAEDLLAGLEQIAGKYTSSVSDKANRYADSVLSGAFDSDEELMDRAKESLDATYGSKKSSIEQSYGEKLSDLALDREVTSNDRAKAKEKINRSYEAAWEDNLDSLAKKGVSHSSIADLTKDQLRSERREAIALTDEEYDRKVQAIDRKIERLDTAYNDALKSYEITYAIKLEDKLNKLKAERDKAVDRYKEEHADDREKAYNAYLAKDSTRNDAYEKENGDYYGDKKKNYEERYDYLVGALVGKSKEGIAAFLKNNESDLKKYLGLYYESFVREVI